MRSPFSAEVTEILGRLRDDEGCIWQISISRRAASRLAKDRYRLPVTRGVNWTCILRWPDRVVSAEGASAEEAMRAALRDAGVTPPRSG